MNHLKNAVMVVIAVIYARVSSREQEQEGYSIPAQLKLLREYASRHGIRIVREFIDVETAKTTGRKSFGEIVISSGVLATVAHCLWRRPTASIATSVTRRHSKIWKLKSISSKKIRSCPKTPDRK